MLDPAQIKAWIVHELPCDHVAIEGDGRHFEAVIISEAFAGLSRIARQQKVNAILKTRFDSGELHALSMQTLTPEEWRSRG